MSARSLVETCRKNFARYGCPQIVVTDNGTNFVNEEMKEMAIKWNFKHSTSAPHHQQANGKAEAAVKIAKRLIQKAEETDQDVWYVLLHWRNIPNKIGSSPASRLFSRSTRCGVPASFEKYTPRIVQNVPEAILENKRKVKYYYDRKSRNLPALETGSPVYVQAHPEISKTWTPAIVTEKLNDRSYVVDVNGASYRRDLTNLRPRKEPTTIPLVPAQSHPPTESSAAQTGADLTAEPEASSLAAMRFDETATTTTTSPVVNQSAAATPSNNVTTGFTACATISLHNTYNNNTNSISSSNNNNPSNVNTNSSSININNNINSIASINNNSPSNVNTNPSSININPNNSNNFINSSNPIKTNNSNINNFSNHLYSNTNNKHFNTYSSRNKPTPSSNNSNSNINNNNHNPINNIIKIYDNNYKPSPTNNSNHNFTSNTHRHSSNHNFINSNSPPKLS
ncbi:transcription factor mef2A-like [Culex quinquefasciatus]|uniref:transcription factor mef2A-like n=1 Tax=Culex quinquefasciatus TaxID=7176 RepID=UPI0018E2ADBC|nr:transcription factor mef2A-like [Culex quinquefasciatus]